MLLIDNSPYLESFHNRRMNFSRDFIRKEVEDGMRDVDIDLKVQMVFVETSRDHAIVLGLANVIVVLLFILVCALAAFIHQRWRLKKVK